MHCLSNAFNCQTKRELRRSHPCLATVATDRRGKGTQTIKRGKGLPVLFADVVLFLETGTAVTFFLTCDTDLFFGVAVFARRVLTFPSGRLLLGKIDFELLLGLDLLSLGVAVPVGRGEDAEGDGDASLKVQVDDFCWRERIFSYNLPRRQTRKE